jgi:hypothetical protein
VFAVTKPSRNARHARSRSRSPSPDKSASNSHSSNGNGVKALSLSGGFDFSGANAIPEGDEEDAGS